MGGVHYDIQVLLWCVAVVARAIQKWSAQGNGGCQTRSKQSKIVQTIMTPVWRIKVEGKAWNAISSRLAFAHSGNIRAVKVSTCSGMRGKNNWMFYSLSMKVAERPWLSSGGNLLEWGYECRQVFILFFGFLKFTYYSVLASSLVQSEVEKLT